MNQDPHEPFRDDPYPLSDEPPVAPAARGYTSEAPVQYMSPTPLKHSGFGIASFILTLLFGLMMFGAIVMAGVMEASSPGGMDEESPEAIIVGLAILACGAGEILALVLGIVGLLIQGRRKVFAILGVCFSAVTLVGFLGLMLVGLAMA